MTLAEALVEAARGRQRVHRAEIWRVFQATHAVEATAGDARERLMRRLRVLVEDGRIELPSEAGAAWDRTSRPPIPEWVALAKPAPRPPTVDVRAIPWAPELAFIATTPVPDHLEDALAIQRFLANGGRARALVPMRERSVELFGDEKRLDRLVRTSLFTSGRLDLGVLRCFAMAPPLVFEMGPPRSSGRPCLVVENHHTWWSFCRWNTSAAAYSAVVYGAGGGFGREAVAFVAEQSVRWGAPCAEYFGDVDRDGLIIPWRAATQFALGTGLRIVPAMRWYQILLERAEGANLPMGSAIVVEAEAMAWLPVSLQSAVRRWLEAGVRLPQELVGCDVLTSVGAPEDTLTPI